LKMPNEPRILSDIAAVPEGANCAIIIRHGDRDGALNQIVQQNECLNEVGIERSHMLGGKLARFTEIRSFSSPIGRCIDTCVNISRGFGDPKGPECTEFLGMSAPFMIDPKGAYVKMKQLGLLGFVEAYVKDSLDRSMVLPCNEGTKMLFSYVIEHAMDMKGGIGVFVTHDMIITPAMAYYFGYDFRTNGLAPFLDGVVLYQEKNGYVARYNGIEMQVDPMGTPLPK
jgi:hypothetical protein